MEIKYTLEILTKDIQDIGKLVENLQNSPQGSTLELDLALSKLRNVYDILTVIRGDISVPGQLYRQSPEASVPPEPITEPVVETPKPKPEPKPEPVVEAPKPKPEPIPEPVVEAPKPKPEPIPEPVVETPKPPHETGAGKDAAIIAEKFAAESSINENLAGTREPDMDSRVIGQSIDHIGRNIGINDRFRIIRELFDGDTDGFGKLIEELDSAGSLASASEKLQEQFSTTPDHEGVVILDNLVKRKYSKS